MSRSSKQAKNETPVILEAAINGMTSKEKNPHAPRSHEEIEHDALLCYALGATIVHAHNSDIALEGAAAAEDYLVPWRRILDQRPDALWYPTLTSAEEMAGRLDHIERIASAYFRLADGVFDLPQQDRDRVLQEIGTLRDEEIRLRRTMIRCVPQA